MNTNNNQNNFKYSAPIPAPLGSTVYRFWTSCCDACWMQIDRDKRFKCDPNAICHTKLHGISAIVVDYNNLTLLIDGWGKNNFATHEEAATAVNKLLNEHRKAMIELGYVLDEDGKIISELIWLVERDRLPCVTYFFVNRLVFAFDIKQKDLNVLKYLSIIMSGFAYIFSMDTCIHAKSFL